MSSKSIVLRKTFPSVTKIIDKRSNQARYRVDTRRKGSGQRLYFEKEKDALTEAKKLAQEIPVDRALEIEITNEVRAMAHKCTMNLSAFGKTLEDATAFYIEHLKAVKKREESLTVDRLATKWFEEKKQGSKSL